MNKKIGMMIAAWLLVPMAMVAQTYSAMWKQVEAAQDKDLPKTAIVELKKIENKARKERAYGQLLKASLMTVNLQGEISSDSIAPAVKRLEQQMESDREVALQAVYATALSQIYDVNSQLEDFEAKSKHYRTLALAHPDVLGKTSAGSYEPFITKGKDSEVFGHDLLSVIGMELEAWQWMTDYYEKVGNCRAACLTAVNTKNTIAGVDSLIAVYGDYTEAGELAIRRYELMNGYSAKERYQWLQESLQRWGGWKRANVLRNYLSDCTNPLFWTKLPQSVCEINKPQMLGLYNLRNLQQLTMRVYRTALKGDTNLNPDNEKDYAQIKAKGLTEVKEAAVEKNVEPAEEKKPVAEPKKEEKPAVQTETVSKYDNDPRVRTGAYRIVGVANTVTVRSGQTIKSISKTYLGPGMECYVEVLNGGITELKEGQTIKIPKLALKKKAQKAKK